jgi:hypothetical protein
MSLFSETRTLRLQMRDREWERLRARGRSYFIWRSRVLPLGGSLWVALGIWAYYRAGWQLRDLLSERGVEFYAQMAVVTVVLCFYMALVEWERKESDYRARHPQAAGQGSNID